MSEERATYTAGKPQPSEQERDPLRLALVAIQAFDQQLKDAALHAVGAGGRGACVALCAGGGRCDG